MARLSALAAALAATAVSGATLYPYAQCDAEYQCIYHYWAGSTEYSWDLRSLCRSPGLEYQALNQADQSTFYFNLCGIVGGQVNGVSAGPYCSPKDTAGGSKVAMYTRGQVMQFPQENTKPTGTCPDLECKALLALDPTTNCQPTVPCTNNCEVVAHYTAPTFNLASPYGDVNGGINLSYTGVPWYPNDFFPCDGQDPDTGLQTERQVTIQLQCNSGLKGTLGNIQVAEVSACNYLITAQTASACPVKGDPFDPYRDDPAHSFGFVVLGATLTVFCYFVYTFGDAKGWWDPIKAKLPAFPAIPGFSGRGGVYGGSYKGLSTSTGASAPATTPISASAYGST